MKVKVNILFPMLMSMLLISTVGIGASERKGGDEEKHFFPSSSYAAQSGNNVFVYGDLLYLIAQQEGLEFAAVMNAPVSFFNSKNLASISPIKPTKYYSVDFDWHTGLRLGAGWHMPHDRWDLSFEWLHFQQKDSRSLNPDPAKKTLFIVNTSPDNGRRGPNMRTSIAQNGKEKWHLDYDTLDLTLSKPFWSTSRLSLNLHVGLRTAWIDQHIKQSYHHITNPAIIHTANAFVANELVNKNHQSFWGIGFRGGIDSRWALTRCFSLFGNVSFSPLWSMFKIRNVENISVNPAIVLPFAFPDPLFEVDDSYHAIKLNADMQIGAQWDFYFSKERFHLGLRAAWEFHYWPNQNQINIYQDDVLNTTYQPYASYKPHGTLSLYGASFGAVFDF